MNTGHWETIEKILDNAIELQGDEQESYIAYACKGDQVLEEEVKSLIEAIEESEEDSFLEDNFRKNRTLIRDIAAERVAEKFIGKKIGAFELTEEIGSGGMSIVFKAKRTDGNFNQQVAIKLIRSGLHSEQILQRFELEKQILAELSHGHIARLYDGGVTSDGNPYLIMEYVKGKPIDTYCNENKLSVDERLNLFKDVCDAVTYAHNNLIVHRDLKAQNIVVSDDGLVKILDFGIAKLLDTKQTTKQLLETQPGQQLWTPQYASPEQLNEVPVTTASDIYSLGVLLHKILTDSYPFNFNGKSMQQIFTTLNNSSPKSLIDSLSDSDAKEIAKKRSTTVNELKKTFKGDLEAIVKKALRKRISERYSSTTRLAEDINNYQSNLPITAKKGNVKYKFKKFTKRHKTSMTFITLFLAVIIGLSIYYTNQLAKQQKKAFYTAQKATTVSNLLKNILLKSSPYGRYNSDISLSKILSNGTHQIKTTLSDQPLLKAEMLGFMAEIHTNLGQYKKAKPLLEKAIQIQDNTDTKKSGLKIKNLNRLGYLLFRRGRFKESIAKYLQAKDILEKIDNPKTSIKFSLYNAMAMVYSEMGQRKKALSIYKKARSLIDVKAYNEYATVLANIAMLYQNLNKFDKAINLLHKSYRLISVHTDSPSPALANIYNNLAFTFQRKGNIQKADSLHQIALKMRKSILPPNHPHIASSLVRYGLLKVKQGKLKEAERMFTNARSILIKVLPKKHWQIESAVGALALVHGLMGNLNENISVLQNIYHNWETQFGKDDWRTDMAYRALRTLIAAKQKTNSNRK